MVNRGSQVELITDKLINATLKDVFHHLKMFLYITLLLNALKKKKKIFALQTAKKLCL